MADITTAGAPMSDLGALPWAEADHCARIVDVFALSDCCVVTFEVDGQPDGVLTLCLAIAEKAKVRSLSDQSSEGGTTPVRARIGNRGQPQHAREADHTGSGRPVASAPTANLTVGALEDRHQPLSFPPSLASIT
jgi:hypothetical protein